MVDEGSCDGAYDGDIECDIVESIMWNSLGRTNSSCDR